MPKKMCGKVQLLLGGLVLPGCFTTQTITVQDLRGLDRLVEVQIVPRNGDPFRAITGPAFPGPESLRYLRLRHGPSSWVVRFGGWPAMYTSGKYLRHQIDGDMEEIPLDDIQRIYKEKYSWPLTFLTLPLTLPPGLIDFLFYHLTFGFDEVDTRFDTYSRPPAGRPDVGQIAPPAPGP